MKLVALAFALASVGCSLSEDCEGRFRIEDGFAASQVAEIRSAGARWNAWVGRTVVTFDDAATCTISRVEMPGTRRGGLYAYDSGRLMMNALKLRDGLYEPVAMHEFGHALGLDHVDDLGSIMSRELSAADFSAADRSECVAAGVCK